MRRQKESQKPPLVAVLIGGFLVASIYINYRIFIDDSRQEHLIFDIGFSSNTIEHYLKYGNKVVGISANPLHLIIAQEIFQSQIIQSKLVLINVGIEQHNHDDVAGRALFFYIHKTNKEWSSFNPSQGCRKTDGDGFDMALCTLRQVDTTSCSALVKNYGVPHYMRIHADGKDWMCLESLMELRKKPTFISIEAREVEWLTSLEEIGYRRFKAVHHVTEDETIFGDDAIDVKGSNRWRSYDDVLKDWPYPSHPDGSAWHWHATK